jgi:predicted 2-oxoglutarate/Fe(II)-dependent dioxygenase YbiX
MVYKTGNKSKRNSGDAKGADLRGIAETAQLFTPQECETLIGFALNQDPEPGKVFWLDGVDNNKEIRSCTQFFMPEDRYPGLYEIIKNAFRASNSWKLSISNVPSVQIVRYVNGDHYLRHTDWSVNKNRRKLSMSIQLSLPEDYLGGEVVLYAGPEDISIPTEVGMATIWPSWTLHQVMPITEGERWCLVAWAEGEAFH